MCKSDSRAKGFVALFIKTALHRILSRLLYKSLPKYLFHSFFSFFYNGNRNILIIINKFQLPYYNIS